MLEKINKFREYLDYVERHYNNVQKAWKLINDKCKGKGFRFLYDDFCWHTINEDVINHDLSKLSAEEFTQYRQWFFPTDQEEKEIEQDDTIKSSRKTAWEEAWEHHKKNNLHHWQTWTKQSDHTYADVFLVMMLVDWIAMGFEFGDTAKEYYEKNKDKIELPDWAIKVMYEIFDCIYE